MNFTDLPIPAQSAIDLYLAYLTAADPDFDYDRTYILDAIILADTNLDLDSHMILRLRLNDDAPLSTLFIHYDSTNLDIRHITNEFDTYIATIFDSTAP